VSQEGEGRGRVGQEVLSFRAKMIGGDTPRAVDEGGARSKNESLADREAQATVEEGEEGKLINAFNCSLLDE